MPPLRGSLVRKEPGIAYHAKLEVGKLLDASSDSSASADWRLFASRLDQEIFTHDWILGAEAKCLPTGKSPTVRVLKAWEESFEIHEPIPVERIIDTLKSIGRIRVASLVETMWRNDTFLDFKDSDEHCTPEHAEGQASGGPPSGRPSQAQPVGSRECYSGGETWFHRRQSPQEVSFTSWQTEDTPGQRAGPLPPAFPTFETQPPITNYSTPRSPHSPHNLKKSNYSLHADGSYSEDRPHQLRQDDRWKTWPRGHKANQGEKEVCRPTPVMGNDTSFIHLSGNMPSAFAHISPLRSFSPVPTNHVASASPVQEISFFLTYSYRSYKAAMEMGMALKARGHNVMVDTKSSAEKAKQLFKTSTYVVVLYTLDYQNEAMGNEKSPLNTKLIFDLIVDEFRERPGFNMRFVPIIDPQLREEWIHPIFRRYPVEQAGYVCDALNAFKAPVRNEVAIQRIVYSSGGK